MTEIRPRPFHSPSDSCTPTTMECICPRNIETYPSDIALRPLLSELYKKREEKNVFLNFKIKIYMFNHHKCVEALYSRKLIVSKKFGPHAIKAYHINKKSHRKKVPKPMMQNDVRTVTHIH